MNKIIGSALVCSLFLFLLPSLVFALQQIAGELVILTPIGSSNSTKYGLINDGKETVSINLRAEGDVADYLSFPKTVLLEPNKITYVDITAKIPKGYNITKGNITGYLYALQEGIPGQVQINIQMKKNVVISVYESPRQTTPFSFTGFFASFSFTLPIIGLAVVFAIIFLYTLKIKRR